MLTRLRAKSGWPGLTDVFSVVCLIIFILLLLRPFYDHDFYWHLKTGEWLWQHKSLPHFDPFTIDPQPQPTDRSVFLLSSYWLFQLLLYAFYKTSGFGGIVVFRFLLGLLLVHAIYRFSIIKNLPAAAIAAAGLFQIFATQFPERPQFISFICMAILLSTILSRPADGRRSLISLSAVLCPTMMIWANSHGGFILGQSILLLLLLTETVKFLHPALSPLPGKEFLTVATAISAALLVSLINPNPLLSFRILFSAGATGNIMYASNLEYSNLWEYFRETRNHIPFIAVGNFILTLALLFRSRERDITWLVLLALFGYMGASHIRYFPFFVIIATLYAMRQMETIPPGKTAKTLIIAAFLIFATSALWGVPKSIDRLARYGWVPASYFPVRVVDFIADSGLKGNLFTIADWGGYVLWRLAPGQKVFCDSRQLFPSRYLEYLGSQDRGGNEYLWRRLVDRYNIQIAILPLLGDDRKPYPLTALLQKERGWRKIAQGNNGLALLRNP